MVGGGVQDAAPLEPVGDQRDGRGLQQAALVVAGLGPRVGEVHAHAGQLVGGQQVFQDVDAVAADQPDVRQPLPVDGAEQLAEAAAVDLDGDDVDVGLLNGHRQGGDTGAAADLQHQRCGPAE